MDPEELQQMYDAVMRRAERLLQRAAPQQQPLPQEQNPHAQNQLNQFRYYTYHTVTGRWAASDHLQQAAQEQARALQRARTFRARTFNERYALERYYAQDVFGSFQEKTPAPTPLQSSIRKYCKKELGSVHDSSDWTGR